jgi:hypothetical protein
MVSGRTVFDLKRVAGDDAAVRAPNRGPGTPAPINRPAERLYVFKIKGADRNQGQPLRAVHRLRRAVHRLRDGSVISPAPATPRRGRRPAPGTIDTLHFTSCADCNLTLAARPGVGHIRRTGDVAEWLKAAVC